VGNMRKSIMAASTPVAPPVGAEGNESVASSPAAPKTPMIEANINSSDDFMSAHMKNLRAAAKNDLVHQTIGHSSTMGADNFLMTHLKSVKTNKTPSKAWQGQAAHIGEDNFLSSHQKKVDAENGPKTFKSTKLYGVAPKGVKGDGYMMQFTEQLEKERKPGVSSIGMVPKVNGSIEMEFLKKVEANNKPGESSIGMAPKVPTDSYMNEHTKKIIEDNKKGDSSIGAASHVPVDSYMNQHFKSATDTLHLGKMEHAKANVPADSFLIQFRKEQREANAVKPVAHAAAQMPADSYEIAHLKKVHEQNKATAKPFGSDKPSMGTDDFTMSVMRKAQKDVMSY